MKKTLKILIVALSLGVFSFASASQNAPQQKNYVKAESKVQANKIQEFLFDDSEPSKEDKDQDEKQEPKSEKEDKEEKARLTKNLNNLLIEAYKVKFSKILGNLSYNIKNKTKEEKLRILSTVLITTKAKIELIESNKIQLSDNKKEILEGVLNHIKDELEDQIKEIAKQK